jgi:hypothetical protein
MRKLTVLLLLFYSTNIFSQAESEIQVYASPTTLPGWTIFELHNNYTFSGSQYLTDKKSAHWYNTSLEVTHGFGKNFELGFYTFTGFQPGGGYTYLGNHIRPRVTVPEEWKWSFGASLSLEFGFIRLTDTSDYVWEGELRPIVDKTFGNWYFSFNPNLAFAVSGDNKGVEFSPQFKTVYTIQQKVGIGVEYYGNLGEFGNFLPGNMQEHLLGPMIDLYLHPMWEVNSGFLFGLTKNSNQHIFKLLIGRRVKSKKAK